MYVYFIVFFLDIVFILESNFFIIQFINDINWSLPQQLHPLVNQRILWIQNGGCILKYLEPGN